MMLPHAIEISPAGAGRVTRAQIGVLRIAGAQPQQQRIVLNVAKGGADSEKLRLHREQQKCQKRPPLSSTMKAASNGRPKKKREPRHFYRNQHMYRENPCEPGDGAWIYTSDMRGPIGRTVRDRASGRPGRNGARHRPETPPAGSDLDNPNAFTVPVAKGHRGKARLRLRRSAMEPLLSDAWCGCGYAGSNKYSRDIGSWCEQDCEGAACSPRHSCRWRAKHQEHRLRPSRITRGRCWLPAASLPRGRRTKCRHGNSMHLRRADTMGLLCARRPKACYPLVTHAPNLGKGK